MIRLSVNINKIAVLRNSRGGNIPHVLETAQNLLDWGALGLTVHPRPDGRHILYQDVKDLKHLTSQQKKNSQKIEFNVEGRPTDSFLNLMEEVKPDQCTLVPDPPSALTSNEGWDLEKNFSFLKNILKNLHQKGIRSSLFIDPLNFKNSLSYLKKLSPKRVEFYTGDFAKTYPHKNFDGILKVYKKLSEQIDEMGIGVNAGHDLNQKNLKTLIQAVPLIQEVSVGHSFICEALYDGLRSTLNSYLHTLKS